VGTSCFEAQLSSPTGRHLSISVVGRGERQALFRSGDCTDGSVLKSPAGCHGP